MDYEIRDHMEHSSQITSKKGINLLTSARGKFGIWNMDEKKSELATEGGLMEAITSSTTLYQTSLSSMSV